jgi:tetratricopeptide (TPR) repeat protein
VGQTLNNLALVYEAQAKYTEAEGLYKRALAIREKALGANHPDVARTLHNLGNVYRAQGKYSERRGSTHARRRPSKKRSVRTIPTWARLSTTWPSYI